MPQMQQCESSIVLLYLLEVELVLTTLCTVWFNPVVSPPRGQPPSKGSQANLRGCEVISGGGSKDGGKMQFLLESLASLGLEDSFK